MDARERAVRYLDVKPRTREQVKRYLKTKGYGEEEIEEAVESLEEYHYIDDVRYSGLYFQYGFEKGRGIARIRRELREKGVSAEDIDRACEELEEIPDQLEAALAVGRSVVGDIDPETLSYEEKQKLKAKIGRRLMSRGFPTDVAYKVIDRLL